MLAKEKKRERSRWEEMGHADPYWAVITDEKYHANAMTKEAKEEFFASGKTWIAEAIAKLEALFGPLESKERALDYGCGVGRLVLPLTSYFNEVIGVDIAEAMLEETSKNVRELNAKAQVELVQAQGFLEEFDAPLDFVHSILVFQHMPVKVGLRVAAKLLALLKVGGGGVLQFNIRELSFKVRNLYRLRERFAFIHGIQNLREGKPWGALYIPMNNYLLNEIFHLFRNHGVNNLFVEMKNNSENNVAFVCYFKKGDKQETPFAPGS